MAQKKVIRQGRVVIVLRGRYAGRKAVVVKVFDDGAGDRKFGHCIIAGMDRPPRRVTKSMSNKKISSRSKVKPFVKFVNFNHILPTRYTVDFEVKSKLEYKEKDTTGVVDVDEVGLKDKSNRDHIKLAYKQLFETQYEKYDEQKEGKSKVGTAFLYTKLSF
jgi:large subunit ribosomal protein L27e